MESETTHQLPLTRLWYLLGDWEGTGKGPEFRFRASAKCSWALDDHFLVTQLEITDANSGQVLSAEHSYLHYDRDLGALVNYAFSLDGMVEYAVGHADGHGRMVLTSNRLSCVPRRTSLRRLRRTVWMMAARQWVFTVERDLGEGFVPYLEAQMRCRA